MRFLVVAPARSGTNLLAHTLAAHPEIVCDGEVFHVHPATCEFLRPGYAAIQRDPATSRLRNADPARFLAEIVFVPMPVRIRAVGFKLMYVHGLSGSEPTPRDLLRADKAIRVIHLHRRNLLEKVLSVEEARSTSTWRRLSGTGRGGAPPPVCFDPAWMQARFEQLESARAQHAADWAGHDVLDLAYEDMTADLHAAMSRVQRFLGVSQRSLRAGTEKLAAGPASERIANHAELKRHFAGTRWAEFFAG